MSLKDLGTLLVQHYSLHEGLWDVAVEMQVAIGQLGPTAEQRMPGAMFGISRVGLVRASSAGAHTVDAAQVNPTGPPATSSRTSW